MVQINDPRFSNAYGSPTPLLACFTVDVTQEQDHGEGVAAHHQILNKSDPNIQNQSFALVLAFRQLTYRISISSKLSWWSVFPCSSNKITKEPETKILLNDISGEAHEGEILGVMGASGSGKSTLIDALANCISKGSLQGMITLNGEVLGSNLLKTISAYVMQDDLLFPMLTVEETIMFAAELRLPQSISKSDKKKRVSDLINQLHLSDCANTMIGDEGRRGVSGGERKRTAIGIEIIHDPIILFLDEPLSGLDSTSAFMVVKVLQGIAKTGSIIIMSVHQPSFRILCLMDQLLVLSQGHIVYSGSPSNLPVYMESLGHPVPTDQNPSEAILDLICDLEYSSDGINSIVHHSKTWLENKEITRACPSLQQAINHCISVGKLVCKTSDQSPNDDPTSVVPNFSNPCWAEISVLSKRSFLNSFRMAEVFLGRFVGTLITGLLVASLYWRLEDSLKGNEDKLHALAFITISMLFRTADGAGAIFSEKNIMLRETSKNVYRRFSYFLSDALTWIPGLLIISFTYSVTTFWGIGFGDHLTGFFIYYAIILAELWAGNSYLMLVTGLAPNARVGFIVLIPTLAFFIMLSGAFVNRGDIPPYWIWLHYLSPAKYAYSGLLQSEFEDQTKCYSKAIDSFDYTQFSGIPTDLKEQMLQGFGEVLGMHFNASKCVYTGAEVIKRAGVNDLNKWVFFWINFSWGLCFRMLFYVTLLFSGSKLKRK